MSAEPLFASVAGQAAPMSSRDVLFRDTWHGRTHVLPLAAVDALDRCRAFQPFEQHVAQVASSYPPSAAASIRQGLIDLRDRNLLIAHDAWLARFERRTDSRELTAIFIRTCGRPAALKRLLASLAPSLRNSRQRYRVILLDDSRQPESLREHARLLADFADHTTWPTRYAGPADRDAFAANLPDAAAALLTGHGDERFGGGRNYNFAALLGTGSAYALLDDDFVFPLRRVHAPAALDLRGIRRAEARFFSDRDAALDAGAAVDGDPFAAAVATLGRTVGDVLATGSHAITSTDLAGFEPSTATHLAPDSTIAAVTQGHRGDVGTESSRWMLMLEGESLQSLWRDGRGYEANREGSALWFGSSRPRLEAHPVLTPFLVDATGGAPPTRASGRSEDELFGLLLHVLDPRRLSLHTTDTIGHAQVDARERAAALRSAQGISFNRWLVETISNAQARICAGGVARHASLGNVLRDLAAASDEHLAESATNYARALGSDFTNELERARETAAGAPDAFRRDLDEAIARQRKLLATDPPARFGDWIGRNADQTPGTMRRELTRFADALDAWPEALGHARTLAPRFLEQDPR